MQRIPAVQYCRRDLYRHLFRHRGKAICAFLLVFGGAILFSVVSPKIYQSQSMLFVRLGRENVGLDPTATLGQTPVITIPNSRENEINSVVEILKSRALAENVVDALGPKTILGDDVSSDSDPIEPTSGDSVNRDAPAGDLTTKAEIANLVLKGKEELAEQVAQLGFTTPLSAREKAILKLQKNLSAEALTKTDIVSISYRAVSPALAQQVVSQYTNIYLDEHVRLNRTPKAHQFLEQQTERLRAQLSQSEEELKELKQKTELASPDSQRELLVVRLSRLQDDLLTTESQITVTNTEVEALREKLEALSETQVAALTTGLDNAAADGMRQLLYTLQLQEKGMAAKYTAEHPELKSLREQIARSEAILNQQQESRSTVTEGPNRTYEDLNLARLRQEAVLKSLQMKTGTLRDQVASAKTQLQGQLETELRIAKLVRDVQLQDASYRKYVDNLEQAHIDHALETERISNINVIQPATLSEKPIRPRLLLNLAVGLVGGVFAGVCLAFASEAMDHSLKTPEEIEQKLNVPLLVSIPRLNRHQVVFNGSNGR